MEAWASDASGDGGDLLGDLLTLLDEPQAPRKRGSQLKRAVDELRLEAHRLTGELERMRRESARGAEVDDAVLARFKRQRADRECWQLRSAVYAHARFLRGLRAIVSMPFPLETGLDVCQYLHTYTRLPRDRHTRWSEYASLAHETRLRSARNMVCRETEAAQGGALPSLATPLLHADVVQAPNGFALTATAVFAVDALDISSVLRAASVAVHEILVTCPIYQCTLVKKKIVDPDASLPSPGSSIHYRLVGWHNKTREGDDEVSIGTRLVTLFKQTDDHAMLLWDYVDDDELHPVLEPADITREAVGVCLIRHEVCDDGVVRPVYREVSTRRYRFHDRASRGVLTRFHSAMERAKIDNEALFRGIMLREIAKEEAAYATAVGSLLVASV